MNTESFVISLMEKKRSSLKNVYTLIWNAEHPLPIGHPFRWIVEKNQKGILIRDLNPSTSRVHKQSYIQIPYKQLEDETTFELPQVEDSKPSYYVKFRAANKPAAVFDNKASDSSNKTQLRIASCIGDWVINSNRVGTSYTGFAINPRKEAFTLSRNNASEYTIKSHVQGLEVVFDDSNDSRSLAVGGNLSVNRSRLDNLTVAYGNCQWHLNYSEDHKLPPLRVQKTDEETVQFKKALSYVGSAMFLFCATVLLWPKNEEKVADKELIPAQYTKFVMTNPTVMPAASAPTKAPGPIAKKKPKKKRNDRVADKSSPKSSAKPRTKKIAKRPPTPVKPRVVKKRPIRRTAAINKAMRAAALQNSIKGLLKGGMTTLLSHSNIVNRTKSTKMFSKSRNAGGKISARRGLASNRKVSVNALGGGSAGGKKSGVGYGRGKVASISGQGGEFVDLDTFGSAVAAGLTKDEVGKVIHAHLSEVRYCYESAMLRNPDVEGKLVVDFTIMGSGTVGRSDVKKSSLPDPRLDDCILRRLAKWKFPRPKGGVTVAVSYPFIFKTLGR